MALYAPSPLNDTFEQYCNQPKANDAQPFYVVVSCSLLRSVVDVVVVVHKNMNETEAEEKRKNSATKQHTVKLHCRRVSTCIGAKEEVKTTRRITQHCNKFG